ncbi:penicillin-binding protein 2 [Hyphobacterium sp. SN044]|uniref:penicillin-binding protein 2 n=1 Tax=Hyphobacterium sp. SN044 TaxID=2912575 RepID=UPI001EFF6D55|nr:penicillin-binding protein 2 [Hyphobacterium sp. SN044]MCF8878421.1 penicillin-binding protein 2 [Hyphobacterium sp. SN044]
MRNDRQEQEMKFTRRTLLLSAGGVAVFGALAARLYTLQILQSERYRLMSDDNQFNFLLVPPSRGRILDRFGEPLAENRDSYRVLIVPEQAGDLEATLDRLGELVPISDRERERILTAASRSPGFRPVTALEDLDWGAFSAVNLRAPDLAGVIPNVAEIRHYPSGPAFSHVIGYVQPPTEEDAGDSALLRHPGFRIGRSGVEAAREGTLRGQAGSLKVEVNAFGRVIRELPEQSVPQTPGEDLRLTLDAGAQSFAYERLTGESAAAVAMDVETGDLLALVSTPGFDPNLFVTGISHTAFQALQNNELRPLFNKALQGTYPPASTFKAITGLAALEAGLINERETVTCTGKIRVGDREFHCWRRQGHGRVNMREAVKTSCDVYFYEVAQRLGIERIHDMALRFGLGPAPDIGLAGVRDGIVPNEQWKRARYGQGWSLGETLITGIGQGFLLTSPLHLAVMTARLASGRAVTPRLYRDENAPLAPMIGLDPANLELIHDGLRAVVHEPGGTSYYSLGGLGVDGVEMAGKTGSAQVFRITEAERAAGVRSQDDLPWRLRDHGMFVCYAPADRPRYAVATVVEHGGGGSRAAARPARDILRYLIENDPSRAGPFAARATGTREG